jgi:hypothetical protein
LKIVPSTASAIPPGCPQRPFGLPEEFSRAQLHFPVEAKYDGTYSNAEEGIAVNLNISLPPNTLLVQGVTTGPQMDTSQLAFQLPLDFLSRPFIRIDAKHGPVNAKITKLRDLND